MANSEIEKLKSHLGMGARANKYKIIINPPTGGSEEKINTLVKNVNLPGRSFADVEVWVQGRLITQAGDSQYDGTWNLTFMDSESHEVRKIFTKWMNYIDDYSKHNRGVSEIDDYVTDCIIQQLSTSDGSVKAQYKIHNCYPKSISDITFSDDSSELIEFTVEFNFSHWTEL
jgi:hypothetical protein